MKKVSLFMIAAFVAVSSAFVGCTEDPTDPVAPTVSVSATVDGGTSTPMADAGTFEAPEGAQVVFDITFEMGTEKLREVHLKSQIGNRNVINVLDSIELDKGLFNTGAKSIKFTYYTSIGKEDEKLTFQALDTENQEAEFSFTITAEKATANPAGFIIKEATLLGGQNSKTGSFYSYALGKVMTIGEATGLSAEVDFAYYYGAANKASIAAPANSDVQTISYGKTKLSSWATKNATVFYVVPVIDGTVDGPEVWWDENIPTEWATDSNQATALEVGDVVFYKTAKNVVGAFVVTNVNGTQAGSITIDLIELAPAAN